MTLGTSCLARPRTFVIAEAGVNHNGSLNRALELVEVAARAGADAVKFQTFKAEALVSRHARKADYQARNTGDAGAQLEMLRALELSREEHVVLRDRCRVAGIAFMSTAFDLDSLRFLAGLDPPAIKVSSGDVTAAPLLLEIGRLDRPVILSTGMCDLPEIERALGVLAYGLLRGQVPSREAFASAYGSEEGRAVLRKRVTLLHCVTDYPASVDDIHLQAMRVMRSAFGLPVGYSDHTEGTAVALAAVALGATVIEKHFTLDRGLPGPDHAASLEPDELSRMVADIRTVERSLGEARKEPSAAELPNRTVARRSLVAATAIRCGELFTHENLSVKRPGDGRDPLDYWLLIGQPASRDYAADELIDP